MSGGLSSQRSSSSSSSSAAIAGGGDVDNLESWLREGVFVSLRRTQRALIERERSVILRIYINSTLRPSLVDRLTHSLVSTSSYWGDLAVLSWVAQAMTIYIIGESQYWRVGLNVLLCCALVQLRVFPGEFRPSVVEPRIRPRCYDLWRSYLCVESWLLATSLSGFYLSPPPVVGVSDSSSVHGARAVVVTGCVLQLALLGWSRVWGGVRFAHAIALSTLGGTAGALAADAIVCWTQARMTKTPTFLQRSLLILLFALLLLFFLLVRSEANGVPSFSVPKREYMRVLRGIMDDDTVPTGLANGATVRTSVANSSALRQRATYTPKDSFVQMMAAMEARAVERLRRQRPAAAPRGVRLHSSA